VTARRIATAAALAVAVALGATGLAPGCRGDDAPSRTAVQAENACAACIDPETQAGSYVSIGVMPAPYPISWANPYDMFVTTLGTTAASAGLDRSHSIGHVLLKLRCGSDEPTYISQTGANGNRALQFLGVYQSGPNYLFVTQTDGKLYTDAEAKKDWDDSIAAQEALENGTYQTRPNIRGLGNLAELAGLIALPSMSGVLRSMAALPGATRHRFLRATMRITDAQCRAILAWKADYVATGGSSRYSVHRAPWVMDGRARYDGGGCASVGYAGAFYAAGLDYQRAATRLTERLQIGTSRLTAPLVRDNRRPNGWYNVQNVSRYVPGNVPCAENTFNATCYGKDIPWTDDHWKAWNGGTRFHGGAKDSEFTFSKSWGNNANVKARSVPLIVFEPERFYKEILGRWSNANYDAFRYTGWCKIDGKVPTIVLDARNLTGAAEAAAGRPRGLANGFLNTDVMLPWP
jgi:hypothetical protein